MEQSKEDGRENGGKERENGGKEREKERKSEGERKWNVATADGFSTRNETTQSD